MGKEVVGTTKRVYLRQFGVSNELKEQQWIVVKTVNCITPRIDTLLGLDEVGALMGSGIHIEVQKVKV